MKNLFFVQGERGLQASDGNIMYFPDRSMKNMTAGPLMNVKILRDKERYAFVAGDVLIPDKEIEMDKLISYFKEMFSPNKDNAFEPDLRNYSIRLYEREGISYVLCYGELFFKSSFLTRTDFRILCQKDGKIIPIMELLPSVWNSDFARLENIYGGSLMNSVEFNGFVNLCLASEYEVPLTIEQLYHILLTKEHFFSDPMTVYKTEYGVIAYGQHNTLFFGDHYIHYPGFSTKLFKECQKINFSKEEIQKYYLENNLTNAAIYRGETEHVLTFQANLFQRTFTAKVLNPRMFSKATEEEKAEVANSLMELDKQVKNVAKYCNKNNISELSKLSKKYLLGLLEHGPYPWEMV